VEEVDFSLPLELVGVLELVLDELLLLTEPIDNLLRGGWALAYTREHTSLSSPPPIYRSSHTNIPAPQ